MTGNKQSLGQIFGEGVLYLRDWRGDFPGMTAGYQNALGTTWSPDRLQLIKLAAEADLWLRTMWNESRWLPQPAAPTHHKKLISGPEN